MLRFSRPGIFQRVSTHLSADFSAHPPNRSRVYYVTDCDEKKWNCFELLVIKFCFIDGSLSTFNAMAKWISSDFGVGVATTCNDNIDKKARLNADGYILIIIYKNNTILLFFAELLFELSKSKVLRIFNNKKINNSFVKFVMATANQRLQTNQITDTKFKM